MGRRSEKYYLFCNNAFLSLFTIKFVRYIYIRQNTLQVGTKKPTKYIGNFRYIYDKMHSYVGTKNADEKSRKVLIYFGSFRYLYTTKYTLSWNKKRLQNKSEISDLFCWLFCFNLQCSCRKMLQKKDFFPNGVALTPFGKIQFILLYFTTNTL